MTGKLDSAAPLQQARWSKKAIIGWSIAGVLALTGIIVGITLGVKGLNGGGSSSTDLAGPGGSSHQLTPNSTLVPGSSSAGSGEQQGSASDQAAAAAGGQGSPSGSPQSSSPPSSSPQVTQVVGSWVDNPRAQRITAQAKRGMAWQFVDQYGIEPFKLFDRLSWTYNWHPQPDNIAAAAYYAQEGIEFVPMQWGKWDIEQLGSRIPKDAKNLLVFNEPNHRMQAAMLPTEAAALWPQLEAVANAKGLRLSSPAASIAGGNDWYPTNTDYYKDPFNWLDDFFKACKNCKVDFVATHVYVCKMDYIKNYMNKMYTKYRRPIWLTEFSCAFVGNNEALPYAFLRDFMEWADSTPWIERYSWFAIKMDGWDWLGQGNQLMNYPSQLAPLGNLYNYFQGSGVTTYSMEAELKAPADGGWDLLCGPCNAWVVNGTAEEQAHCVHDCGYLGGGQEVYMGPAKDGSR